MVSLVSMDPLYWIGFNSSTLSISSSGMFRRLETRSYLAFSLIENTIWKSRSLVSSTKRSGRSPDFLEDGVASLSIALHLLIEFPPYYRTFSDGLEPSDLFSILPADMVLIDLFWNHVPSRSFSNKDIPDINLILQNTAHNLVWKRLPSDTVSPCSNTFYPQSPLPGFEPVFCRSGGYLRKIYMGRYEEKLCKC